MQYTEKSGTESVDQIAAKVRAAGQARERTELHRRQELAE
jgi:hypothetical protein